jgi:hypothetical protein
MKAQEGALYIINIYKGGLTVPYVSIVNKKHKKNTFKVDVSRKETRGDRKRTAFTWPSPGAREADSEGASSSAPLAAHTWTFSFSVFPLCSYGNIGVLYDTAGSAHVRPVSHLTPPYLLHPYCTVPTTRELSLQYCHFPLPLLSSEVDIS